MNYCMHFTGQCYPAGATLILDKQLNGEEMSLMSVDDVPPMESFVRHILYVCIIKSQSHASEHKNINVATSF